LGVVRRDSNNWDLVPVHQLFNGPLEFSAIIASELEDTPELTHNVEHEVCDGSHLELMECTGLGPVRLSMMSTIYF